MWCHPGFILDFSCVDVPWKGLLVADNICNATEVGEQMLNVWGEGNKEWAYICPESCNWMHQLPPERLHMAHMSQ